MLLKKGFAKSFDYQHRYWRSDEALHSFPVVAQLLKLILIWRFLDALNTQTTVKLLIEKVTNCFYGIILMGFHSTL
jgi:hypothetical protein